EADAGDRVVRDENFGQRQRLVKRLASGSAPRIVVTSIQSLLQPLPSTEQLAAATQRIAVGERLDLDAFTHWLAKNGCQGTTAVELAGEFSLRGGILDLFPPDATDPLRIELFDEEVESIRTFDVATQRSLASLSSADVT